MPVPARSGAIATPGAPSEGRASISVWTSSARRFGRSPCRTTIVPTSSTTASKRACSRPSLSPIPRWTISREPDGSTISQSGREGEMTTTSSVTSWATLSTRCSSWLARNMRSSGLSVLARRVFAASRPRCGTMIRRDTPAAYRGAPASGTQPPGISAAARLRRSSSVRMTVGSMSTAMPSSTSILRRNPASASSMTNRSTSPA